MSTPRPLLSVGDGVFLTVGMVQGVGIFKLPSLVAGNSAGAAVQSRNMINRLYWEQRP